MRKIYVALSMAACTGFGYQAYAQPASVVLIPNSGTQLLFPSITSAYAAIPASPSQNYTIEILPTYNGTDASEVYPIQLTDKGLTAGGPTITIRPAAGNNGETIQRVTPAAGAVIQFNGADNVILDGRPGGVPSSTANYLTVNDPTIGNNASRNIELLNSANNNTIQFINSIAAEATATAGSRNIFVAGTTSTPNNNNTIQNNVVTGGLRGVQDFGTSDALANSGTRVLNNLVRNFGAIGIFAGSGQQNMVIQGNTISLDNFNVVTTAVSGISQQSTNATNNSTISDNTISMTTSSTSVNSFSGISNSASGTNNLFRNTITALSIPTNPAATSNFIVGISLGTATGGSVATFNVSKNKLSGLSSTGAANIRGMSIFPLGGSTLNIDNNFVAVTSDNASATAVFGILLGNTTGANYTTNLYFNSIRLGGSSSTTGVSAYGIFKADANTSSVFNMMNNISVVDRDNATGMYWSNTTGTISADHNNFHGSGFAASFAAAIQTSSTTLNGYSNANLAAYKTAIAPQEQNTTFSPVTFVSNTDLHLAPPSTTDPTLKGVPVTGITTDIDDNPRPATAPTKGADEPGGPVPVQLFTFTGAAKGTYNQLQWATASESNNAGFQLQRSTDGVDFRPLGFVPSKSDNGNSAVTLNYSFDDMKPFSASSYYRLKQVDKDGRFTYSNIVTIKGKGVTTVSISNLYPNPVKDNFNVVIGTAKSGNLSVVVTDAAGKNVLQRNVSVKEGDNIIPFNSASLQPGVYMIRVVHQGTLETSQVQFVK
ncbi:T9SS type A sorting domain-containing protein [Aridibaculum aurantiacum]|uniref:T9SS type A sorting domain-containing protein n=1 Tax=Aridibaculum aurantiacum TaxID=2810307 RepID=UPI001A96DC55|nr:T9SS type A sorting domain-containing protein [Aridibaculum aurantiacum]